MSTQSIAVETLVVEELQSLFAAETVLEKMYSRLSVSPCLAPEAEDVEVEDRLAGQRATSKTGARR